MDFVRYQALHASPSGRFPGVFALVNGLAAEDRLTQSERQWKIENNAWFESRLIDPGTVEPTVFDRNVHRYTSSWFRSSCTVLLQRTSDYLEVLSAHGVGWVELQSDSPGPVVYEDDQQVVVAARHDPQQLDGTVGRAPITSTRVERSIMSAQRGPRPAR